MTALQPNPCPENPGIGENPQADGGGAGFSPLSPFSEAGEASNTAAMGQHGAALDIVRSYRRTPPPKPPAHSGTGQRKGRPAPRVRASPPKLNATSPPTLNPVRARAVGVMLDWREGVAKLVTTPPPPGVPPHRWHTFQVSAVRLVRDHGAALQAAGWDTLDLFGLHAVAPAMNAAGMGLAWLLGDTGTVLDVGPDAVGMRCTPGGARLAFHRRQGTRAGAVPAWEL